MAKQLHPKPPFKLVTNKHHWQNHVYGCEVCRRVHVGRPHTIAFTCYKGAQLLKLALAEAYADGVVLTDQGRAAVSAFERAALQTEGEHG